MELRHLRYFIAVAEHESVRIASQRIHVTQPAISRQIQDLEEELGAALFERTARGLKLTAAGVVYLAEARNVLALLDGAARAARRTAAGLQGRLRVGFIENAGWDGIVPATFSRFQAEAPDIGVELVPRNTLQQLRELESGALDGGFVNMFDALPENFSVLPLFNNKVVLAVPRAWNLPAGVPVAARSLAGRPFVGFPRPIHPAYYDRLVAGASQMGLTLNVVQEVSTETAIMSLVSAGIGAAFVNSANRGRPPALVQFIDFADLFIPMPFTFVSMKENANPALARFIKLLRLLGRDATGAGDAGARQGSAGAATLLY